MQEIPNLVQSSAEKMISSLDAKLDRCIAITTRTHHLFDELKEMISVRRQGVNRSQPPEQIAMASEPHPHNDLHQPSSSPASTIDVQEQAQAPSLNLADTPVRRGQSLMHSSIFTEMMEYQESRSHLLNPAGCSDQSQPTQKQLEEPIRDLAESHPQFIELSDTSALSLTKGNEREDKAINKNAIDQDYEPEYSSDEYTPPLSPVKHTTTNKVPPDSHSQKPIHKLGLSLPATATKDAQEQVQPLSPADTRVKRRKYAMPSKFKRMMQESCKSTSFVLANHVGRLDESEPTQKQLEEPIRDLAEVHPEFIEFSDTSLLSPTKGNEREDKAINKSAIDQDYEPEYSSDEYTPPSSPVKHITTNKVPLKSHSQKPLYEPSLPTAVTKDVQEQARALSPARVRRGKYAMPLKFKRMMQNQVFRKSTDFTLANHIGRLDESQPTQKQLEEPLRDLAEVHPEFIEFSVSDVSTQSPAKGNEEEKTINNNAMDQDYEPEYSSDEYTPPPSPVKHITTDKVPPESHSQHALHELGQSSSAASTKRVQEQAQPLSPDPADIRVRRGQSLIPPLKVKRMMQNQESHKSQPHQKKLEEPLPDLAILHPEFIEFSIFDVSSQSPTKGNNEEDKTINNVAMDQEYEPEYSFNEYTPPSSPVKSSSPIRHIYVTNQMTSETHSQKCFVQEQAAGETPPLSPNTFEALVRRGQSSTPTLQFRRKMQNQESRSYLVNPTGRSNKSQPHQAKFEEPIAEVHPEFKSPTKGNEEEDDKTIKKDAMDQDYVWEHSSVEFTPPSSPVKCCQR